MPRRCLGSARAPAAHTMSCDAITLASHTVGRHAPASHSAINAQPLFFGTGSSSHCAAPLAFVRTRQRAWLDQSARSPHTSDKVTQDPGLEFVDGGLISGDGGLIGGDCGLVLGNGGVVLVPTARRRRARPRSPRSPPRRPRSPRPPPRRRRRGGRRQLWRRRRIKRVVGSQP